ncbi:MAG: class I SAM-dependent methyltransferase [Synechococcales bacterium]|nr:class I SAM-dependent methyltransferase [Synechococcales bacterium]
MMTETPIAASPTPAVLATPAPQNHCRFCGTPLKHSFVDLGMSPPCQLHRKPEQMNEMEAFFPLHAYVCDHCFLVQIPNYVAPDNIFTNEYAYYSSFSDSWLAHAKRYTDLMVDRFGLNSNSQVVELASNDGYLLQYFLEKGIPVLGIEPSGNVAEAAMQKGIDTVVKFFGRDTAREQTALGKQADLLLGNNVLAHVPDINDFVGGMKILLKPNGVITMEFPHLMRLMADNQFDTIYHEHYSYLSFIAVEQVFAAHGLTLFDVEELPTHGGSLRIYARHTEDESKPVSDRAMELRDRELAAGFKQVETYSKFGEQVRETKRKVLEFLIQAKRDGKTIVGYGAPGKGNTLLNYCGIRTDFIDYTVDRNPFKQGNFLPGSQIPIYAPEKIRETKPDYLFILPWNLKDEIMSQMAYIREWGGQFVVPIPEIKVYP